MSVILHADMDAFYASIEQRDHPEYRGRPVIVGAGSTRGVVAAASYEARQFGVRSAMPAFRARELCPHGVYLPPRMAVYSQVSAEVHAVFRDYATEIEPIALDEAFLDIAGSVHLFGSKLALGHSLKRAVREKTGLVVSAGIARSKLVAKIACSESKPDGLRIVEDDEVDALLRPLPVRRLWGVGPVLAQTLAGIGIETIADLADMPEARLRLAVGDRAVALGELARGRDVRRVEGARAAKSYGEENTFETDTLDRERVSAVVTAHAEAVARRLRKDGYKGRTVTLRIKLGRARGRRTARGKNTGDEPDYPLLTRARTLRDATDDGSLIKHVAMELWDKERLREPVRLLGVSLTNLERADSGQLGLFDQEARRASRLGHALDAIEQRFGRGTIGRAVEAPEKLTPSFQKKRGE